MYFVYILTNEHNKMFYTGLTDKLLHRNAEHKYGWYEGFTKRYAIHKSIYYEVHADYASAARREKLIKRWKREYKINVIERMNPHWDDLFFQLLPTFDKSNATLDA